MKTVLAIDLGGTKILIGELTLDGKVLQSKRYPSIVTSQRVAIDTLKKALKDFLEDTQLQGEVQGIGIGLVGRIDRDNGIWIEIHPELSQSIDVAKEIEAEFGYSCYLGNDVYCATLAEKTYGIGKQTGHFIYMNIGTGIAAGCVVNGNILEGANFDAGEVGHMVVDFNSEIACPCGRTGCVEVLASGLGMHNRAITLLKQYPDSLIKVPTSGRITAYQLFRGYDAGDEMCQTIVSDALKAVATTLMNLIRVTDPKAIVLGGGVVDEWFIDHLAAYFNPKTIRFITNGVSQTSLEAKTIGLRGAALLVNQNLER